MKSSSPEATPSRQPRAKAAGVTLADVASRAGVSPMTVSNVLNGRRKNSPHYEAIMEAVAVLNYEPDLHAQRLASGFSPRTLGLYSSEIDLGVSTLILKGIQQVARNQGYHMPLDVHDLPLNDAQGEHLPLVRLLCRQRPRGIVFCSANISAEALEEFRAYQESGGVLVCYGYEKQEIECDQVVFDSEDNTYQAAKHLIAQGHTRLGFRSHGYPTDETPRMHGFRRALREHGLECRDEWMFSGPLYEEGGEDLARQYLALRERPTGVCIVNDNSAWVFVNALIKAGLRVPEDVSVVGCDDMPPARYCIVPLSTTAYPVQGIIDQVSLRLLGRLDGTITGPPKTIRLTGPVVVRESSGPPPATSD